MCHSKGAQAFALLLGVVVLAVAENSSSATEHAAQQVKNTDSGAEEVALDANQTIVLKTPTESSLSKSCEMLGGRLDTSANKKLEIFTVDAFTNCPFSGNAAAVIPLLQDLDEKILQQLASELNLPETSYVTLLAGGTTLWQNSSRFSLRWFSPTTEIPLCGHATLATAHVLFHSLGNSNTRLKFETKSGTLSARRDGRHITLDFPSNPPEPLTRLESAQLAKLVSAALGDLPLAKVFISRSIKKLLICLRPTCSIQRLKDHKLDTGELMKLHNGSLVKSIILTMGGDLAGNSSQAEDRCRCYSRNFAPWNGVPEDPVSGSAHTVLGPFWSKQLNCTVLKCKQLSQRGGEMTVTMRDDGRVDLTGESVSMIHGHIAL